MGKFSKNGCMIFPYFIPKVRLNHFLLNNITSEVLLHELTRERNHALSKDYEKNSTISNYFKKIYGNRLQYWCMNKYYFHENYSPMLKF